MIVAQKINIQWFDATLKYAPNSSVSVVVNPTDTFAVDNVFYLELSNASGGWDSPIGLVSVNEFYTPVLNGILPSTVVPGRYKLRVRSTNPVWIEETPSFDVINGPALQVPTFRSTLVPNTTYFNCTLNSAGITTFGSLTQSSEATTKNLAQAQRMVYIDETNYRYDDTYHVLLIDVLSNNQIVLPSINNTVFIPDNLGLGTYVLQVAHTSQVSTVRSCVFLYHGNGTNLSNASSEEICVNNIVTFGVETSKGGIGRNYKGSKYAVDFGDDTAVEQFTHQQLMNKPSIVHAFSYASCSETGSEFNVTIQLYNKGLGARCDRFEENGNGTTKSVNVSLPPVASFKAPQSSCVGKLLYLDNTTIPGYYGTNGCRDASNFYWYYKAPGETDFMLVTDRTWINSKNSLTMPASVINKTGCWTFRVEAQNQDLCQTISSIERDVLIEIKQVPIFSASNDSICVSNSVYFRVDDSILLQSCTNPTFTWVVTPAIPENSDGFVINSGSGKAEINFTKPGLYSVRLRMSNACGTTQSAEKKIFVSGGAGVSFATSTHAVCVAKNSSYKLDLSQLNLKPNYNVNFGKIGGYKWSVTGNEVTNSDYHFVDGTSELSAYPIIELASGKTYKIKVEVVSDCTLGASDILVFSVNEIPELQLSSTSQTICSGSTSQAIIIADTVSQYKFNWKVLKSDGLVTDLVSGSGVEIPPSLIINNTDSLVTLQIQISPIAKGCEGSIILYNLYVLPHPALLTMPNKIVCNGAQTSVQFKSLIQSKNQVVKWKASNTTIGVANEGLGDFSFISTNRSNSIIESSINYFVETTYNGVTCRSDDYSFTISVLPSPQVNLVENVQLCAGDLHPEIIFSTSNMATSPIYRWTVIGDSVGLPLSGIGNLPAFKAQNNTNRVLMAQVKVEALLSSDSAECVSEPSVFNIRVNPTATAVFLGENSFCRGAVDMKIKIVARNGKAPYRISYSLNNGIVVDTSTVPGNDSISLIVPTYRPDKLLYRILKVQDMDSASCDDIEVDSFLIEIADNPMIATQPIAFQQVCVGARIKPLKTYNAGGAGVMHVQWYSNTLPQNYGGQKIVGADSLTYTPAEFQTVGHFYYYCTITMNGTNCGSATSDVAHVEVVADPIITDQTNLTQTLCLGSLPKHMEVKAEGGLGVLTYQWYVATDTTQQWSKIDGASESFYQPRSDVAGVLYYSCEIKQEALACSVISKFYRVEVLNPPRIISQPLSQLICKNENASALKVVYTGANRMVNYQWYVNTTNDYQSASVLVDATDSIYQPQTKIVGKLYYFCMLTFETNGCAILTSEIAEIHIVQTPVVSNQTLQVISNKPFQYIPGKATDTIPDGTKYRWTALSNTYVNGTTDQLIAQDFISGLFVSTSDSVQLVDYLVTPEVNGCVGQPFVLRFSVLPALGFVVYKQDISCFGERNGKLKARVFGGVKYKADAPYRISWTGPSGYTAQSLELENLEVGVYELQVTDSIGDVVRASYQISQPEKLAINVHSFVSYNCFGDSLASIDVQVTGGKGAYVYSWTKDSQPFASTEDLSNLGKGVYQLIVKDSNLCTVATDLLEVKEREQIVISVLNQVHNSCFGGANGSVEVAVVGGTRFQVGESYKFKWTGPANFSSNAQNITNLLSGIYTLVVTDSAGCNQSIQAVITQPSEITAEVFITPVTCYGKNDAKVSISITGGLPPYQVVWSNHATGVYQENIAAGIYSIKIVDANNCEKNIQILVAEETDFIVIPTVKQISCNGANDGRISLKISSINSQINVRWNDGSTAGSQRNNLAPGIYKVEVSDGSPCVLTNTFVISEPPKLEVTPTIHNSFACATQNSGAIHLSVAGGVKPYKFKWSTGATTQDIQDLYPGKYFVTITDSLGCELIESFELIRHEPLQVNLQLKSAFDNVKQSYKQICTAQVTGGLAPYSYRWSTDTTLKASTSEVEVFSNQTISLQIVDALGCLATAYVKTEIPQSDIVTQIVDCTNRVYRFDVLTPPAVFSNLIYLWEFGDGDISNVKSPTHNYINAGDYHVRLKIIHDQGELNFSTTLQVEALPVLKLDREARFCKGDSVELVVSGANAYIWNDGTKGSRKVIKREGNYSVTGVSVNGCTATLDFTAKHFEDQNYSISTDKEVLTLDDPNLKVWTEAINLSKYSWDFGDGNTDEGSEASHLYDIDSPVPVRVKLKVINPYGCIETSEKTIWLLMESLPNTFTPNNDGMNDKFMVGVKVKIYNANGVVLYEGSEGWDGTYKGQPVATDTYYFIVFYSTPLSVVQKAGYVFLAR